MADLASGRSRTWSRILGVILIILGVIAMASPLYATLTLIKLMGWLLIIAAIEQGVDAFLRRNEGGLVYKVLLAVLYGVIAIMLLRQPVSGAIAATAIISILFLMDGFTEVAQGMRLRREGRNSQWLFVGGILSLLFGAIILYRFPSSALWTVGLLIGIRLIVKGIQQITSSLPSARPDISRPGGLKRAA